MDVENNLVYCAHFWFCISIVTSSTSDLHKYAVFLVIFEMFFVDLRSHFHHVSSNIFHLVVVTGEIQPLFSILFWAVTKATLLIMNAGTVTLVREWAMSPDCAQSRTEKHRLIFSWVRLDHQRVADQHSIHSVHSDWMVVKKLHDGKDSETIRNESCFK